MPGRAGDDGKKVIKKYEFQLQATGTRFSLIYSAAGATGHPRYTLILKTKPDSLTNQGLPGLKHCKYMLFLNNIQIFASIYYFINASI